ncbi:hypothetical protein Efla_005907 [Eimeria flavescens]
MAALRWQACCPLVATTAVLLLALLAATLNHFSLPDAAPAEAPPDEFSEGRARLLLQLATRSVRTFGSCDNEVAMPVLLHSFIREQLLLLRPPTPPSDPPSKDTPSASGEPVGSQMQAVVGRVSYVLLVQHEPRDASTAATAAEAADAATRLRRIHPPGQPTDVHACLCGIEQQQHLLRDQQQHHVAAVVAAAATGLHQVLLKETQKELPPPCAEEQQRAACAAALRESSHLDLFSPSAAAAAAARFEARAANAAEAAPHAEMWEELSCLGGPRLLHPDSPLFVAGTLMPRLQCFKVVRHFLAPPATVSVLLGLSIQQQQQQQQEQQQQRQAAGTQAAEKEAEAQLGMFVESLSKQAQQNHLAAAAAATAAAEAAGVGVLEHLCRFLLSVDVGFSEGSAGGFALEYRGKRTALYVSPRNLTVEIKPFLSAAQLSCKVTDFASRAAAFSAEGSSEGIPAQQPAPGPPNAASSREAPCRETQRDAALMLAAHYDSAPSSPGISDDLAMCAVALEVGRAGVYRHLRAVNALQLQELGVDEEADMEGMLPAPLIINLNGAEETMLLAAHAFASQHPAARKVKLAVNLEAAGSRGKSYVLQMPRPFARQVLDSIARLPSINASAAAADVWNSGQFPGETDFRIWAEVLGLQGGLDMAWIAEGSTYHTKRDTLASMQQGSVQHLGSNLLHLLQPLLLVAATADAAAAGGQQGRSDRGSDVPFYQDVLGRTLLRIPWEAFNPLLLLVAAARAGPLATLLLVTVYLQRSHLFSAFYGLLMLLGLLGPRVALLLWWYFPQVRARRASTSLSGDRAEVEKKQNSPDEAFRDTVRRCSALLTADALGAALPSVLFFQAYLALLDGTSGPAGRIGEDLLRIDLLMSLGVLLPVLVLLPATLVAPLVHVYRLHKDEESQKTIKPELSGRRRKASAWKIPYTKLAAVAAAIAVACCWFGLLAPLRRSLQSEEEQTFAPHFVGDVAPGSLRQLLASWGFLPSSAFPFSPERPLQLHFVSFKRTKLTAEALVSGGSGSGEDSSRSDLKYSSRHHAGTLDLSEGSKHLQFSADLEPLARTHSSAQLVRRSTHGVAVVGLGTHAPWNPAIQDFQAVLAAMRKAVLAAEEAAAAGKPGGLHTLASAAAAMPPPSAEGGEEGGKPDVAAALSKPTKDTEASFRLKEEPPSGSAPLRLAHLHRTASTRTHWSLYTDALAFLTPTKPASAAAVHRPGLRGEVALEYNESEGETSLTLLIGGSFLLTVALPAARVKGWNLERQAPLQKLNSCDCYMVTISTPQPPVSTKLQFFFHGNEPVKFTTWSGVFDATAPNRRCSETPLFSYAQGSVPLEHTAQRLLTSALSDDERSHIEHTVAGHGSADVFWRKIYESLPPHITASSSSAEAVEWLLPKAPFKASFAFD